MVFRAHAEAHAGVFEATRPRNAPARSNAQSVLRQTAAIRCATAPRGKIFSAAVGSYHCAAVSWPFAHDCQVAVRIRSAPGSQVGLGGKIVKASAHSLGPPSGVCFGAAERRYCPPRFLGVAELLESPARSRPKQLRDMVSVHAALAAD